MAPVYLQFMVIISNYNYMLGEKHHQEKKTHSQDQLMFLSHIYPFIDGLSIINMYNPSIFIDMFIDNPSVIVVLWSSYFYQQ